MIKAMTSYQINHSPFIFNLGYRHIVWWTYPYQCVNVLYSERRPLAFSLSRLLAPRELWSTAFDDGTIMTIIT